MSSIVYLVVVVVVVVVVFVVRREEEVVVVVVVAAFSSVTRARVGEGAASGVKRVYTIPPLLFSSSTTLLLLCCLKDGCLNDPSGVPIALVASTGVTMLTRLLPPPKASAAARRASFSTVVCFLLYDSLSSLAVTASTTVSTASFARLSISRKPYIMILT